MNTFGRNLKQIREDNGLTQTQLAEMLQVTTNTVSGWETRNVQPRRAMIDELENLFSLTDDDLMSDTSGAYAKSNGLSGRAAVASDTYAPIAGFAPAGDPSEMISDTGEEHWVPPHVLERWPSGFFVRVNGDSMNLVIPDGAFAFVAPDEPCNGHVGLVKVNGDEATVKRVRLVDDVVILTPESTNQTHKRRVIDSTDPDAPNVRVIGRVVWMDSDI